MTSSLEGGVKMAAIPETLPSRIKAKWLPLASQVPHHVMGQFGMVVRSTDLGI